MGQLGDSAMSGFGFSFFGLGWICVFACLSFLWGGGGGGERVEGWGFTFLTGSKPNFSTFGLLIGSLF